MEVVKTPDRIGLQAASVGRPFGSSEPTSHTTRFFRYPSAMVHREAIPGNGGLQHSFRVVECHRSKTDLQESVLVSMRGRTRTEKDRLQVLQIPGLARNLYSVPGSSTARQVCRTCPNLVYAGV